MAVPLRVNTATAVLVGPFLDEADGVTPLTGLTVSGITVRLYKASNVHPRPQTIINPTASGGVNDMSHVENGWYSLELATANVDAPGPLRLTANITGALPVWHDFEVRSVDSYDSAFGSSKLPVNVDRIVGLEASGVLPDQTGVPVGQVKLAAGQISYGNKYQGWTLAFTAGTAAGFAGVISSSAVTDDLVVVNDGAALPIAPAAGDSYRLLPLPLMTSMTALQVFEAVSKTVMTEEYAPNASQATIAQMLHMLYAAVMNYSISGTAISMKKLDGVSQAMTAAMNDATNPTQRIRDS